MTVNYIRVGASLLLGALFISTGFLSGCTYIVFPICLTAKIELGCPFHKLIYGFNQS